MYPRSNIVLIVCSLKLPFSDSVKQVIKVIKRIAVFSPTRKYPADTRNSLIILLTGAKIISKSCNCTINLESVNPFQLIQKALMIYFLGGKKGKKRGRRKDTLPTISAYPRAQKISKPNFKPEHQWSRPTKGVELGYCVKYLGGDKKAYIYFSIFLIPHLETQPAASPANQAKPASKSKLFFPPNS